MIKKIIACLTICFIITGLISPVFSDASALPQPNWSDPGISEIINISDLTGWMLNGGTYDVSTYTDAESFMNDYFAARTKTRLEGSDYQIKSSFGIEQTYYSVGDSAYAHPLDVNRVIASSYRDHTGYGRRLSNEVNDALLSTGNLYDTKIPLLNEVEFANFVGYNHDALRLYSEFFSNNDDPTPSPDPNYIQIINYINEADFSTWDEYKIDKNIGGSIVACSSIYENSFFNISSFVFDNSNYSFISAVTEYLDVNIVSNTSTFSVYCDLANVSLNNNTNKNYLYSYSLASKPFIYDTRSTKLSSSYHFNSGTSSLIGTSGTLSGAFDIIKNHFAYVNIYVDGELWALAGSSSSEPTITPEFPDAVGGEDLPNTTWPIFRPRAPYYTSVPGMLQAIEDAIADDGKLDIDDLKPYLTDENGDPVPDPIFDPEPVPIPVPDPVNPDIVPGLPVLPAIPPEIPGFNGVSVLAEIINFTNQSLPTALIVTFWGIVFGIVILGLIKILHK